MIFCNSYVRFGAIPRGEYTLPKAGQPNNDKKVTVYELEPGDMAVLNALEKSIAEQKLLPSDNGKNNKEWHYEDLKLTITDAQRILRHREDKKAPYKDTSVIYMAVADQTPCGILIGNMPKLGAKGITTTYRDKPCNEETELDWLMTWPLGSLQDRIIGVGKALLTQFFSFCSSQNPVPKTIYIRAEDPEQTVATHFYKAMSCQEVSGGLKPWQTKDGPVDIVTHLYDPDFKPDESNVQPMEISSEKARTEAEKRQQEFKFQALQSQSVPIEEVVNLSNIHNKER